MEARGHGLAGQFRWDGAVAFGYAHSSTDTDTDTETETETDTETDTGTPYPSHLLELRRNLCRTPAALLPRLRARSNLTPPHDPGLRLHDP